MFPGDTAISPPGQILEAEKRARADVHHKSLFMLSLLWLNYLFSFNSCNNSLNMIIILHIYPLVATSIKVHDIKMNPPEFVRVLNLNLSSINCLVIDDFF